MKISLVSVGRSGAGKSSLGNIFLGSDSHEVGPFETGVTHIACTTHSNTQTNSGNTRVYTDLPGLPDTNPRNTAKYYDICIDAVKKHHTAILFVFEFKKIDEEELKLAELLFREMNKAQCEKILVINDRNPYFSKRPTMEAYQDLAKDILRHTKLNVSALIIIEDVSKMKTQLDNLARLLEGVEATPSPELKRFAELGEWIDTIREREDFHRQALKDLKNALRRTKIVKAISSVFNFGAFFIAGAMDAGSGTFFFTPLLAAATNNADDTEARENRNHLRNSLADNRAALDRVIRELWEAKEHHRELRDRLGEPRAR